MCIVVSRVNDFCHEVCMTRQVCFVTVYFGVLLFQILFQSSLGGKCVEEEESPGE